MAKQQQQREREREREQLSLPLPLHYESATTLADKIRRREVTSLELVELFIQRIIRYDNSNDNDESKSRNTNKDRSKTSINAVVVRCFDQARTRAKELDRVLLDTIESIQIKIQAQKKKKHDFYYDGAKKSIPSLVLLLLKDNLGPLHGVPITVKENNDVCGLQTTIGNPISINNIATTNSPAVQQLLNAGAIIIGKTNLPLNCNDVQTYNPIYGTTSNPYNIECTPGGSSGGSAASLCIGFTALELGGDIGGSIRLPAALCGIYGHKPTLNAVSYTSLLYCTVFNSIQFNSIQFTLGRTIWTSVFSPSLYINVMAFFSHTRIHLSFSLSLSIYHSLFQSINVILHKKDTIF